MKGLRVIVKKPSKKAVIQNVVDDLLNWQEIVGGYIEVVLYDNELNILLVCNEEGKFIGLEPNIYYYEDVVVGNIIFVSSNDEGDFVGLDDEQIEYVMETLKHGGLR
jgi:hypothetical protein